MVKVSNKSHGQTRTKTYRAWQNMKNRCYSSKNPYYYNYGGRGITVCDRWLHDFQAFFDDMGECPPNLSIDRIDTNGNYEPSNCRWATRRQQVVNQGISKVNKSGYKGVYWHKDANKWRATIGFNNAVIQLGDFSDLQEAVKARKYVERQVNNDR